MLGLDAALPIIRAVPGPVLYVAKVRAEPLPFHLAAHRRSLPQVHFRRALLGDRAIAQ